MKGFALLKIPDYTSQLPRDVGSMIIGRSVTDVLRVSPNGNSFDGSSWRKAFQTIPEALNAASTDAGDVTLIEIAPHATNYDIDAAGDPTWAANVILKGSHRNWTKIKNTHDSAASILKLIGKSAVIDLNFNLGTGNNGLIMTHGGFRILSCQFVGEDLTGAKTALWLDGASIKHGKVIDVDFLGHVTYMTSILIDEVALSCFDNIRIHDSLVGIKFVGDTSDRNCFDGLDIGDCALGLDIDAGNKQHFKSLKFHDNTLDVDDEVGDHLWGSIKGQFAIVIHPDNFTGIAVNTGDGANIWTASLQTVYTHAGHGPFRIVAIHSDVGTSEWYRLQLTNVDGAPYFDDLMFDANKREGVAAPSGTEYIFNKGTVIKARSKSEGDGIDNLNIWLEIQEI